MDDIAVDIGGTQLRGALYPLEGIEPKILKAIPTRGDEAAIERLYNLIESIWPHDNLVRRIAMGVPGALNPVTGITYQIPNIPNWNGLHLKELVEKGLMLKFGLGMMPISQRWASGNTAQESDTTILFT